MFLVVGEGHQEDMTTGLSQELDLGNQRLPILSSVPRMHAAFVNPTPHTKSNPRTWDSNMVIRLSGLGEWLNHCVITESS